MAAPAPLAARIAAGMVGIAGVFIDGASYDSVRIRPYAHAETVARLVGAPHDTLAGAELVRFLAAPLGGTLIGLAVAIGVVAEQGGRGASALTAALAVAAAVPLAAQGVSPLVLGLLACAALVALARGSAAAPPAARRSTIWDSWLLAVCAGGTLLGVTLPIAVETPLFAPWRAGVARLVGAPLSEVADFWRPLVAALGGAIAGKLLLCALLAARPFRERRPWARNAIAASLATWFIFDSAGSMLRGAWFNVYLVNLPFAALMAAPLVATWRQFSVERAASSSSDGSAR